MPSNDLVLNVRQIANYPSSGVQSSDQVLLQRGGLGGPYGQATAATLVSTALADGSASLRIGMGAPGDAVAQVFAATGVVSQFDGGWGWNSYYAASGSYQRFANGAAAFFKADQTGGFQFYWAGLGSPGSVIDFGGPQFQVSPSGYVTVADQVLLGRDPSGPCEAATAQWVQAQIVASVGGLRSLYNNATVWSFNNRIGMVILNVNDIMGAGGAPVWSPSFGGTPTAPTPSPSDWSNQIATTGWVWQTVQANLNANLVISFNGRTGAVALTPDDVSAAGAGVFAPLASPNLSGVPTAPTAATASSTSQIATTAFVHNAVTASTSGVASFNTRVGAVTLVAADVTGVGGALLASPVFTGTPQAPTASPGTSTLQIASTAFVGAAITAGGFAPLASPAFTGVPAGPTATAGTSTTQLATTAFVQAAVTAATAGVSSFNARTGAVTLQANDVSAVGGALLAGPAFTGLPTAPTATAGTSTTQLATTAFVQAAIAQPATVAPLMNQTTAVVGTSILYARQDHVHPTDTTRAAQSSLANYLLLTGGTLTGALTPSQTAGIVGTTTNNNAAAGAIGEFIYFDRLTNVAVANSSGTNVCSISLTAGDWDVEGWVNSVFSTGGTLLNGSISTTSNTIAGGQSGWEGNSQINIVSGTTLLANMTIPTGRTRISISATTTIYLVVYALFSSGTCNAQGSISARRIR